MRRREIKWLIAIVFIGVLSGMTIKSWQYWQRNHFQCSGEMRLLNSGYQDDISLRFVFDSTRGLVIVRGEITPPQGESFTINQNIWFSFTRDGQHYFLRSETVSVSIGETEQEKHINNILPKFFLQPQVPFYLNIQRLNQRTRLLYTSRAPSLLCET
ncbi:TPA: hypothetical protein ACYU6Z_001412 [Klebsiella quasipneumoniae subsp. quasipneumoniae]